MKLYAYIAAIILPLVPTLVLAETGYITIQVEDTQHHPVRGVEIGIAGIGGSGLTGDDGKARLALGKDSLPGDSLTLQLLHSPAGKDFVILSPWDYRTQVPSFANKPENFITIVIVRRGDRAILENGTLLASLISRINKTYARPQIAPASPQEALLVISRQYGLNPGEVDKAIRALGAKTTDPYEAGVVALYERNLPKATAALEDSLKQREQRLETDQNDLAATAFFLGESLREQGRYHESVIAYQKCLRYHPDDPIAINNMALSLSESGDYASAEPLYHRALAINEKKFAPDHPEVAGNLNNLALLLRDKGRYADAEPIYRRALAIDEKALGPEHPTVATILFNFAILLRYEGDNAAAESLFRRALAIDEKAFGEDHPFTARDLSNLAVLLRDQKDYDTAERLLRQALAIDEKLLGPEHPDIATEFNNLAMLLKDKGDYAAAEPLLRRALAINEKILGPEHPDTARNFNYLASLLEEEGNYKAAEPLFRRALAIDEKVLDADHPSIARDLNNLATLLGYTGDYATAESLLQHALAIDEKTLGSDHPTTNRIRANLADLLKESAASH